MLSSICILKSIARKTAVTKTGSVILQFQANFVKNKNDFPNAESMISFDCWEKSKNLVSRNKVELTGIVERKKKSKIEIELKATVNVYFECLCIRSEKENH